MKKRLLSLFSIFFLLVSLFSINISKIHANENQGIQPRLPLCTSCFQGTVSITRKKIGSNILGEVKCIHGYSYGMDIVIQNLYQVRHTCSNCGVLLDETQAVKSYECHGYN